MPVRRRADTLLCMNNSVSSRERAQELIIRGQVFADGSPVTKPAKLLPVGVKLTVKDQKRIGLAEQGLNFSWVRRSHRLRLKAVLPLILEPAQVDYRCFVGEGRKKSYRY